jgi:hypothetical protein|tara:strand:+ start:1243 stop:1755 length:513 start_codon:yes stop_codon:yes gene_type:complete
MEKENQIVLKQKYELGFIANNKQEFKRKVRNLNLVTIIDELESTPSISKLSRINQETTTDEVVLLLIEASKFFNVKNGLNEETLYDIADLIISEYKHYTMYDIGLCLKMAKLGRFGKVYERLDGGVIMDWISQYEKQRDKAILRNAEDEHSKTKGDNSNRSSGWINFNTI